MGKVKRRIFTFSIIACLLLAAALPFSVRRSVVGAENAAAVGSLNNNLVVKYDMGNISGGKIKASKWENGKYVPAAELDATVTGSVTNVSAPEGSGGARFGKGAYAVSDGKLNIAEADGGMTVTAWVKNLSMQNEGDWAGLFEVYSGSEGGRFGKSTITGNKGTRGFRDDWNYRQYPGAGASYSSNGSWNSFIVGNDGNNSGTDSMVADKWHFVAFTVTENTLMHYRDAELKITYPKSGTDDNAQKSKTIITSIWNAIKSGNTSFALRSGNSVELCDGDTMDDLRVYKGAMTQENITALYNEYKSIGALGGKNLKLGSDPTEYTINDGSNVTVVVEDGTAAFPEIIIGDAVKQGEGNYAGTDFSYTYTVAENSSTSKTATVSYVGGGITHVFTVTVKGLPAFLTDIEYTENNGVSWKAVDGFSKDKYDYSVTLSPDSYGIALRVTAGAGQSTSDMTALNAALKFDGTPNEITVYESNDQTTGESEVYSVKLNRASANVLPALKVGGKTVKIASASENIYVEAIPTSMSEDNILPVYTHGSTVSNVAYASGVLTFKITDAVNASDFTDYTVTFIDKKDSIIAYWDFDGVERQGTIGNYTYKMGGKAWDKSAGAFTADSTLDMIGRTGGDGTAATSDRKSSSAVTSVDGVFGKAIEFPKWGYATVDLPAVNTSGFTFSTWAKLTGGNKWEPIFSLYDNSYTKGAIFEKGVMQKPLFNGGNVTTGWQNINAISGPNEDSGYIFEKGWRDFNSDSGLKHIVVSVSYVDGVGEVRFYVNGTLIKAYLGDTTGPAEENGLRGGNLMASNAIAAIRSGAHFGLHRHCYDMNQTSVFDDVCIYGYAMNYEEVEALYNERRAVLDVSDTVDVEGLADYNALKIGNAPVAPTEVSGKITGVTANGISFEYDKVSDAVSYAKDRSGIAVTLRNGLVSVTKTVRINRILTPLKATSIGYIIGSGAEVTLSGDALSNPATPITVKVNRGTLTSVSGGAVSIGQYAEDSTAANYVSDFKYDAASHAARVTLTYKDYPIATTVYTINFVEVDDRAEIVSVAIDGGKTFAAADFGTDKNVKVAVIDISHFNISAVIAVPYNATVDGGEELGGGKFRVEFDENDISGGKLTFTVTSENGAVHTPYTLEPTVYSDDATLTALSVGSLTLSPAFSSSVTEYTVNVDKGTDGIAVMDSISATAATGASIVKSYAFSDKKISITVTAENGTTKKIYVVTLNELDTDATLSEIKVGDDVISSFDKDTLDYTYKYGGDISEVGAVTVKCTSDSASAQVGALVDGKVTITVTAENGVATKTYTVTFKKLGASSALGTLKINGSDVALTDSVGTVTVGTGVRMSDLDIEAVAEDSAASVSFERNESERKIVITVTAENGTKSVYTVNVTSEAAAEITAENGKTEDNYEEIAEGGCGSFAGGGLLAIGSIFAAGLSLIFVRRKKQ